MPPPIFSSHRSTGAPLHVSSGSGVARSGEDGIAFNGRTRNKVPSSRTTPFSDLHSGRARIHEKQRSSPEIVQARPPGKPTGVTVAPYNTGADARGTLSISWTANPNGNKTITNHEIQWSPNGTSDWKDLRTVSGGLTETLFTGLSPGTTRHIRIRSQDDDNWGPWSDVVSGTTNAVSRPGSPATASATVGPTTINLSWTAPADNGGSPITEYVISGFVDDGKFAPETGFSATTKADVKSYTVTGLMASTKYIVSINSRNSVDLSTSARVIQVTTAAVSRPGPPATASATVGPTTINLSWTAPADNGGSPITEYVISGFVDDGKFAPETGFSATTKADVRSYTVTGLMASTKYIVSINSRNSVDLSTSAQVIQVTTAALQAPAAPTGLTATASGRSTINLSWTAPSDNGGAAITGYKIESRLQSETSFSTLVTDTKSTDTEYSHTGLTPSTQRFYRVSAINSEGAGAASSSATAITAAATRPGRPTGLTATAVGRDKIKLSWTAPTDDGGKAITGYRIDYQPQRGWPTLVDNTGTTATEYTHEGLAPSTTHTYLVRARNGSGPRDVGAFSNQVTATTDAATAPGAPSSVTATADGPTAINLSWEAPADDGGAAITGYRVEFRVAVNSGNWTVLPDVATLAQSVENLQAGTTIYARVTAKNSVDYGTASEVVNATTSSTARAPAAPTGLTATAEGPETISLFWTAPTNTGGAAITGYQIEVSPNGTSNWDDLVEDTKSTKTNYTHTGLDAGTTRHYRVRARNSAGAGAASNVDDATTLPATVPAAPTDLTATADGATTINLSWKAPTNRGGIPLTGYQMEVSPNGNTWTNVTPAHTGTGRTYSHTGLTAGTTRYYRVYARNAKGPSAAASNVANATTNAVTATAPGAPTGLTATAAGQTRIDLRWTAPSDNGGAAITGYQIEVSPTGLANTWTNLVANTNSTTTTYAHTGLTAGTTRHYRVRAINSVDPGAASNTANATTSLPAATAPGAPTGLTATASGPTTINLSWTAPSTTGGAAITGYRVEVSPNGTDNWTNLVGNTGTTGTTYAHRGLSANTTRHYRVRAINTAGAGAPSNVAMATTGAATAPGAPTGLTATADGQTTINLRWAAPTNTGGAAITGYRVEVSPNGTDNWNNLVANTQSTATTYAHTRLSAGTTRHYRVRAINAVGTGNPSTMASATTSTPTSTVPNAPTQLTATASGRTTINLSWTAPADNGGAAITGYRVEVSPNGTDPWTDLVANIAATTYSHTGLSAGVMRYYRVRAINAVGASDASTIANATTDGRTVPSVPTSLMATASGQTIINLRWAVPTDNGGAAVTGYQVEVSEDAGSTWMDLVANTTATTYSHTGLPPETTRHYRVRAINAVGTGAASNVASATTEAATVLSFAGAISSQRYPVDLAIAALVLPTAIGGTPPYTYALSPETLPEGLSLEDGRLGGTPTAVTASQGFTWTVTDALGAEMTIEFTLEIYEITFVTTVMNQSYDRGQGIDPLILPEVTGGTDPVQYTLNLLSLPSGLRFDASTRTIAGTPVQITPPVELTYKATDAKGAQASVTFTLEVVSPVATEPGSEVPRELVVHANYPNPFRTSTNLLFDLPWPAEIKLDVLDLTGRRVYTHPMVRMAAGREQVITLEQVALPAGVYLYRMVATSMEHGTSAVKVGHLMRMR